MGGSDDGFLARTFHMYCDDVPNTICVIESNHGNVFGGFTTVPWKSDLGRYVVDEEAFVYVVRKKKKALKKAVMYLQYTSSQHSVVHNKYMGPVFGYGHDIYIRNKRTRWMITAAGTTHISARTLESLRERRSSGWLTTRCFRYGTRRTTRWRMRKSDRHTPSLDVKYPCTESI